MVLGVLILKHFRVVVLKQKVDTELLNEILRLP